ncbi:conserved Plasmodium protein, unknown function [Plasmodium reichenowi]|uniref:Uncharacterized protein n=1 Tax=Plasmodium reichenowi TaxID=5854 RepID=A0A060RP30_PLARE|nr:conserved Plasmodium protein, unknown function [Plasmodium reichenowi]
MEAPVFKPIHDVIRIKKKEHDVNIKSDIYKKFLELKKEAYINLENKNIKVIIYENMNYDDIKKKEKEHENYNSKSSNSSFCDEKCNEDINKNNRKKNIKRDNVSKKNIKDDNNNDDENNKNNIQNNKQEIHDNNIKEGDEKEYIDDVVKEEKKNRKVLGTLKILYNFYVNLFDKLKEDVENIQNNTNHNNIDLFRDINLYTNYISMFDILNLCEDLHIIKNFINSKKECELIWILTLNYFDNIKENVFQRYRHKINVTYKRRSTLEGHDEKGLQEDTTKNIEQKDIKQIKHEDNNGNDNDNDDDDNNKNNHNNNNNNNNIKNKKKDTHNEKIKTNCDNSYLQKNNNNSYYNCNYNYSYSQDIHNQDTYYRDENHNIKEYIYDNLHDKENCIMYRKVNFFIFVYILIYIIKTSTRKIQAIKDDIKKVKSFFFFLNLYEKKKTMEILQNIYKDKYLQFFQNYRGKEEIEEYRKRKIFRHKFSFYNINKILYDKDDLIKLKNKNMQHDKEDKKKGNRQIVKNENYYIVKGMKNEPEEVKEKETKKETEKEKEKEKEKENEKEKEPILNIHNKIDDQEGKEKREDVNKYELTNYIETIDMKEENIKGKFVQEENKKDTFVKDPKKNDENNNNNNNNNNPKNKNTNSSCCSSSSSDDHGNHNKNNVLLNQYIFDYIFKNYCYKKKYWKVRDGICVDYGIIKKEKKKFKIDIYNHSKYNINVDIDIDKELPLLVIFKDKLFCINSKYSIYLQVDNNENVGEKLGCIHVKCKYKNVHKQETFFKIPVYICLE